MEAIGVALSVCDTSVVCNVQDDGYLTNPELSELVNAELIGGRN